MDKINCKNCKYDKKCRDQYYLKLIPDKELKNIAYVCNYKRNGFMLFWNCNIAFYHDLEENEKI